MLEMYRSLAAQAPRRADVRRRAAPGAAGALDRQGRPRQADRRPLRLLFGAACRRRAAARADQGLRHSGRRRRAEAVLRVAADAARRHPAEGTPLLLEVRVPAIARTGALHAGHRARVADRLAALGDSDLPARRRDEPACPRTTPPLATATRPPSSTSRARGSTPKTTRRTSSGREAPGATCASSRPAARTSTSSPKRKATSAPAPRTARTTRGWPRSRPSGIPRICSGRTRTSVFHR